MKVSPVHLVLGIIAGIAVVLVAGPRHANAQLVPGTGKKIEHVGDDFEDEEWSYDYKMPKASEENDEQTRPPTGKSKNGRWNESPLRGQPDHIVRVPTPEGGLPDSFGALELRTLNTGSPRVPTRERQQDDLLANTSGPMRGMIPISREPSVVVRVYVPEFDQWERNTGTSFGFRIGLQTTKVKESGGFLGFGSRGPEKEPYWPGIFLHLKKGDGQTKEDAAQILIRGNSRGYEIPGPALTPGWWTLGMSCTSNGAVHFYAREGVENLTAEDLITSQYPYGYRAEKFTTFFFNVANKNDLKTWSTAWVIDDPELYLVK